MAKKKLLIDNTNILKQICNLAHLTRGLLYSVFFESRFRFTIQISCVPVQTQFKRSN